MANQLYPKAKEGFLGGLLDLDTDVVKAVLCRDTFNSAHEFLSSLVDIVATSPAVTTPTILNGVFDSDNLIFATVGATTSTPYLVLFVDTGVAGTSRLIAHIDTATGLPVTPDGTNINVTVNAAGWFTL